MNSILVISGHFLVGFSVVLILARYIQIKCSVTASLLTILTSPLILNPLYLVLLHILGIPFSTRALVPIYLISLILIVLLRHQISFSIPNKNVLKIQFRDLLPPFIIILAVFTLYTVQLKHGFIHADAVSIWFSKAVIMFENRHIDALAFQNSQWQSMLPGGTSLSITRPGYPILVPLNITYIFTLVGSASLETVKLLWLAVTTSLLLCLYYVLDREFSQPLVTSLGLAGLIFTPGYLQFYTIHLFGYADLWLMLFFGLILVLNLYGNKKPVLSLLAISCLVTAAAMTKAEGAVGLLFVVVYTLKHVKSINKSALLISLLVPLAFLGGWYWHTRKLDTATNYTSLVARSISGVTFSQNLTPVLSEMLKNLSSPMRHHLMWPAYIIASIMYIKNRHFKYLPLIMIPLVAIALYASIYVFSPHEHVDFIAGSLPRYASQWLLYIYILMLVALKEISRSSVFSRNRKNRQDH
jgi:hypothetical protein